MPLPMFDQEYPHQLCSLAYIQEILECLHLDSLTTVAYQEICPVVCHGEVIAQEGEAVVCPCRAPFANLTTDSPEHAD